MHAENQDLSHKGAPSYSAVATPARRKRGPSLSRRTGQTGTVFQHSKTWDPTAPCYGKFWADVPGCPRRVRRTVALGVCRTKSMARQRLREHLERECINSEQLFRQNTAPAVTFRQQAEWWTSSLPARKRRPVKPATISGWRDALNAWLLPDLGDKLLTDVSNKTVRELVEKMSAAELSPKTIVNYVQVVKLVLASAVDEEGEQIYPRKWNHDFIQLPVVRKDKQRRPTVTEADLAQILSNVKKRKYAVLFARAPGGYWFANRRGACVALNRFRARLPCASRPPQPLAWDGTGAKDVERCAHSGHSPSSRNRTLWLHLRCQWLSLRNSARRTLTAAKRLARPSRRQTRRLSRVPPLSSNVAPKERRSKRPGTLLDGPRTRGSR